jgi:MFS family permease
MSCGSLCADLRKIPREAWILVFLNVFASFGYFSVLSVLVLFLTQEHGYDDQSAANMYGAAGVAPALWGIVTGPLNDRLGVRYSIAVGSFFAFLGMLTLGMSYDRFVMAVSLFIVMPFGMTLSMAAYSIGGKRYSFPGTQSYIFSLLYFSMNLAAAAAGHVYDFFRTYWPDGTVHYYEYSTSNERLLMIIASVFTLFPVFVSVAFMRRIRVGKDGTVHLEAPNATPLEDAGKPSENFKCSQMGWKLFYERYIKWYWSNVFSQRLFWQLVTFMLSMVFVRQIYRQLEATMPKFALRVIGPHAPIGFFYSINPTVIMATIWLSPLLLRVIDPYTLQICGSFLSAISIYIIALMPNTAGITIANLAFSIGEAIYSPQTTAFVMSMSPQDHEGTYANLAAVPLFFSNIVIGHSSGSLLKNLCPEPIHSAARICENSTSLSLSNTTFCDDQMGALLTIREQSALESCSQIWVVVASVGLATPLFLILLYRFIYTDDVKMRVAVNTNRFKTDSVEDEMET